MEDWLEIKIKYETETLYEFVNNYSGSSVSEIAKKIGWSVGKVYTVARILEKKGLVKISTESDSVVANLKIYPASWKELLPEDVTKKG